jgi:ribosomal protein L5
MPFFRSIIEGTPLIYQHTDEQLVFPEIDSGKVDVLRSLQVTIVTNARNDEKARALLEAMGMPFVKEVAKN